MKEFDEDNRRQYDRYATELKIQFAVNFDVRTKVDFRVKEKSAKKFSAQKYSAVSRNISAEGVGFIGPRRLKPGDVLLMEIFIPSSQDPINMVGEVKWSKKVQSPHSAGEVYETGVLVRTVKGQEVEKTIFRDQQHELVWSIVLESVFGNFKRLALERKFSLGKGSPK